MQLARTNGPPVVVSLHLVSQEWGEGASFTTSGKGAASAVGDASWVHTFYDTALWDNPGGDFEGAASAEVGGPGDEKEYVWGSTDAMMADVQGWLDDDSSNDGWLLAGGESLPLLSITFIP